jgi:hypothetical protein
MLSLPPWIEPKRMTIERRLRNRNPTSVEIPAGPKKHCERRMTSRADRNDATIATGLIASFTARPLNKGRRTACPSLAEWPLSMRADRRIPRHFVNAGQELTGGEL